MPKKRRKSTRPGTMQRNAVISSFRPRMAFGVRGEKEPEPVIEGRAWLKSRGELIEPIRDVHEVVFRLPANREPRSSRAVAGVGSRTSGPTLRRERRWPRESL